MSPDQLRSEASKAYGENRLYAPAGNNSCGGEGVEQSVRRGWFQRLKRDYPGSPWARKLSVYW